MQAGQPRDGHPAAPTLFGSKAPTPSAEPAAPALFGGRGPAPDEQAAPTGQAIEPGVPREGHPTAPALFGGRAPASGGNLPAPSGQAIEPGVPRDGRPSAPTLFGGRGGQGTPAQAAPAAPVPPAAHSGQRAPVPSVASSAHAAPVSPASPPAAPISPVAPMASVAPSQGPSGPPAPAAGPAVSTAPQSGGGTAASATALLAPPAHAPPPTYTGPAMTAMLPGFIRPVSDGEEVLTASPDDDDLSAPLGARTAPPAPATDLPPAPAAPTQGWFAAQSTPTQALPAPAQASLAPPAARATGLFPAPPVAGQTPHAAVPTAPAAAPGALPAPTPAPAPQPRPGLFPGQAPRHSVGSAMPPDTIPHPAEPTAPTRAFAPAPPAPRTPAQRDLSYLQRDAKPPLNRNATVALILSIVGLGLFAVIAAIVALVQISRDPWQRGKRRAVAALIITALWMVGSLTFVLAAGMSEVHAEMERQNAAAAAAAGDSAAPVEPTAGAATNTGGLNVQQFDCIEAIPDGFIRSIKAVPCAKPHRAQVYATFALPDGAYPGDAQIVRTVASRCEELSEKLTLSPGLNRDTLSLGYLHPTGPSWKAGARTAACLIGTADTTTAPLFR
jgi:hypothetical protein